MSETTSGFSRFFRNAETGKLVLVQPPNLPLAMFLMAAAVRAIFHPHGTLGTVVATVAAIGLIWWAIAEIGRGESPFRRVLGAAVLAWWLVRALGLR